MCWSAPVSLAFGLVHCLVGFYVQKRQGPYYREFSIFVGFYALMEFLQMFQWLIGTHQNLINTTLTVVAYLLIWLQPIMFSLIGVLQTFKNQSNGYYHGYYIFALQLSCLILLVALGNLGFGLISGRGIHIPNTNFENITCTTIGKYGHLDWKFGVYSIDFQPTHIMYLLLIMLSVLSYPKGLKCTLGLGWLATFIVSLFLVAGSSEFPAYWCLLSLFADIPIVIYEYTRRSTVKERTDTAESKN